MFPTATGSLLKLFLLPCMFCSMESCIETLVFSLRPAHVLPRMIGGGNICGRKCGEPSNVDDTINFNNNKSSSTKVNETN